MRNGNITMGASPPTSQPGQPILAEAIRDQTLGESRVDPQRATHMPRPEVCGAMTQQRSGIEHWSTPQRLVQLVGYRNPTALAEPRSAAAKR